MFLISGFCLWFGWMLFLAESFSILWKYFYFVGIHCSVYIINSLLAASCMCSWALYLFDCKPRLINFFFIILCGLKSRPAYIFYFIERYRWRSVFPWLRFVDQILLSQSIFFSITCTYVTGGIMINRRQLLGWSMRETHEYANVANASQRLRQPMFKCGLQSRAAYINFWHHFVRLIFKGG